MRLHVNIWWSEYMPYIHIHGYFKNEMFLPQKPPDPFWWIRIFFGSHWGAGFKSIFRCECFYNRGCDAENVMIWWLMLLRTALESWLRFWLRRSVWVGVLEIEVGVCFLRSLMRQFDIRQVAWTLLCSLLGGVCNRIFDSCVRVNHSFTVLVFGKHAGDSVLDFCLGAVTSW